MLLSPSRRIGLMFRIVTSALFFILMFSGISFPQAHAPKTKAPLRVGILGLVHGHVHGFLEQSRHSPEIEIVGIAEPDQQLLSQAAQKYGFDPAQLFTDWDKILA